MEEYRHLAFLVLAAALLASCSSTVDGSGEETIPRGSSTGANLSISVSGGDHDVNIIRGSSKVVNFTVKNVGADPIPPSGLLLTATVQEEPAGIIETADSFVIDAAAKEFSLTMRGVVAGRATVTLNITADGATDLVDVSTQDAFILVTVSNYEALNIISDIVGWIYFIAWSVSFYPQIYDNWRRKSVIGLNFDFLSLNIVGFVLYSVFNIALYWIHDIQADYFQLHPTGVNPVQINDVIFSLHAVFACIVTIAQCLVYDGGDQAVSHYCKGFLGIAAVLIAVFIGLGVGAVVTWLTFVYVCSYVKLAITLIKYVPQAYMNYSRKSTVGWSIGNVMLDFTGGFFSIGQMFIISYNNNDWGSIFGDPTKFGLGLFSVLFDIFFMLQHYIFYRTTSYQSLSNDVLGPEQGPLIQEEDEDGAEDAAVGINVQSAAEDDSGPRQASP